VQDIKPGVLMPNYRDFSDADLAALVDYLEELN
jgi:cytochrome c1